MASTVSLTKRLVTRLVTDAVQLALIEHAPQLDNVAQNYNQPNVEQKPAAKDEPFERALNCLQLKESLNPRLIVQNN